MGSSPHGPGNWRPPPGWRDDDGNDQRPRKPKPRPLSPSGPKVRQTRRDRLDKAERIKRQVEWLKHIDEEMANE